MIAPHAFRPGPHERFIVAAAVPVAERTPGYLDILDGQVVVEGIGSGVGCEVCGASELHPQHVGAAL